jgi:hypothetical protein
LPWKKNLNCLNWIPQDLFNFYKSLDWIPHDFFIIKKSFKILWNLNPIHPLNRHKFTWFFGYLFSVRADFKGGFVLCTLRDWFCVDETDRTIGYDAYDMNWAWFRMCLAWLCLCFQNSRKHFNMCAEQNWFSYSKRQRRWIFEYFVVS